MPRGRFGAVPGIFLDYHPPRMGAVPTTVTSCDLLSIHTAGAWKPSAEVRDHLGRAIPATMDFFVAPPEEIGPVCSAYSDVNVGKALWSIPVKVAFSLAIMGALFASVYFVFPRLPGRPVHEPLEAAALVAAIVGVVAGWQCFRPTQLSYVGRDGAVIYSTRGNRVAATAQIVHFADVAEILPRRKVLRTKVATKTVAYDYLFLNSRNTPRLRVKGEYIESIAGRIPRHRHDFAVAVERAWHATQAMERCPAEES